MKALTFLPYAAMSEKSAISGTHGSAFDYVGYSSTIRNANDFYSQPFTPPMLDPESEDCLFDDMGALTPCGPPKGWHSYRGSDSIERSKFKAVHSNEKAEEIVEYDGLYFNDVGCQIIPKTLNSFLVFCEEAGISLEWSPKAIEMLTGGNP